jgi:membrane protease YdiL (CAAX protease family)
MASNSDWREPALAPGPAEPPLLASSDPPSPAENPPWSGWDVIKIAALTLAMIFVFVLIVMIGAQRLFYPKLSIMEVGKFPLVSIFAQLGAYLVVLAFMYVVATQSGRTFAQAISWKWPGNRALTYLIAGVVFSVALQGLARLLPMPKSLPIDSFFQTSVEAWVLSVFGMTLAPLVEEFFFRGFLYPVLARKLGMLVAIALTAAAFCAIHVQQLGKAWGPVLIVFLIGLVLTIIRAVTKSVAAGVLTHMAYNGTISVLAFIATDGFRHLDKIAR